MNYLYLVSIKIYNFSKYFKNEINKLEDYNLQKELEILEYLSTYRYSS